MSSVGRQTPFSIPAQLNLPTPVQRRFSRNIVVGTKRIPPLAVVLLEYTSVRRKVVTFHQETFSPDFHKLQNINKHKTFFSWPSPQNNNGASYSVQIFPSLKRDRAARRLDEKYDQMQGFEANLVP